VKDEHEFLWSAGDTHSDFHDVPESYGRRSASEDVSDGSSTNGCPWNRLSDGIPSHDCAMTLTDDGYNLTINKSRDDSGSGSDFWSFTPAEMVSVGTKGRAK